VVNRQISTALHLALWKDSDGATTDFLISVLGADVQAIDCNGNTPLHLAAIISALAGVRHLLAAQADVFTNDNNGLTPLHHATKSQSTLCLFLEHIEASEVDRALETIETELVKCVDKGVDHWDMTGFFNAAQNGNVLIMKAFLAGGFDPDRQDNCGRTALHIALACIPPKTKVAQMLLAGNASMFIQDVRGNTPFDVGADWNDTEIAALFADQIFSRTFHSFNAKVGVGSQMFIKSLISPHGLCDTLFQSVDEFYALLDRLQNPGFALGFDIFREKPVLAEPLDR